MRSRMRTAVRAAAAAGAALALAGFAIPATRGATVARQSPGPPNYGLAYAGYQAGGGRWFRWVSTTVTVPAPTLPAANSGNAVIALTSTTGPRASVAVMPGGGAGSVQWSARTGDHTASGVFSVSPKTGDKLKISIYYDQHGRASFTATELAHGATQTVRANVGSPVYTGAMAAAAVVGPVHVPQPTSPLWRFAGTHVTTYSGDRGTLVGPWTTSQLIVTTTGTAAGAVVASPATLSSEGQDFSVWVPFAPVWTTAWAGYETGGGGYRFRWVCTTLTVPTRQPASIAHGGASIAAWIALRAAASQAQVTVLPGGGSGSVTYSTYSPTGRPVSGVFAVNPRVGDKVKISVFYDQKGHGFFTATDTTRGTTQTVRVTVGTQNYFDAVLAGSIDNNALTPPPADIKLWAFAGSQVTSYGGQRGTILGPWSTARFTDTTTGTAYGAIVMDAPALRSAGQDFAVWLRHR